METTPNLALPYIMPSQAQKHVTHNEALRALDALLQLCVLDRDLTAPPVAPAEGDRYLVAAGAGGAWAGKDGRIAAWQDGGWTFFDPRPGWLCFIADEGTLVYWTGAAWQSAAGILAVLQNLPRLGLGTTADAVNPFAAKLNKALWTALSTAEGGSGDLRYTMNKQGAANVLSLLMQSNWSGRAEIGLTGNDDLSVKVSADGSGWTEALRVQRQSGRVSFPATNVLTDFALSLYADSGRFAGPAARDITIGSFAFPSYFQTQNGASVGTIGKFIHNNNDYGGTAGTLNAHVKDLIDRIRAAAYRRYGLEFHVAEVTAGAGTALEAIISGGVPHYLAILLSHGPRIPALTFHAYMRALDAPIIMRRYAGQTIAKDGVTSESNVTISPSDGWVSMTIWDEQDPRSSAGYQPMPFNVYMAPGSRFLLACPALLAGTTRVNDDIGVIAGINRWLG